VQSLGNSERFSSCFLGQVNALGGLQVVQFNSHRIQNYTCMLLFFLKLIAKLPLRLLRAVAGALGAIAYLCSQKLRATVTENLAQAGVKLDAKTVIQATARGAADMIWVWFNPQAAVAAKVTVIDLEPLGKALSGEQACMVITPHLGCFEALAKWYTSIHPMTAMYRRPDKAWVAQIIESARAAPQLSMAPADASGVRMALKTLKHQGTLGILPDQVPKQGEGVWLPWFGRNAYTITLPAKLHASTGAAMYIVCALPNATGWDMVCDPVRAPDGLSAEQLTAHLNQALERMVLRAPLHYAWSYKRYKAIA
jgi:Kdo2-lipid IVA lauroyltransferase/acyltransferase